jgi:hypothetical protein
VLKIEDFPDTKEAWLILRKGWSRQHILFADHLGPLSITLESLKP